MMNHFGLRDMCALLLFLLCGTGLLLQPAYGGDDSPVSLAGTLQFDLASREGETYRIFVRLPQGEIPEAGSPVVYFTDGNAGFPLLYSALQQRPSLKSVVLVGIGYPPGEAKELMRLRARDLVFPIDAEWLKSLPPEQAPTPGAEFGGADQFLEFILGTLRPEIERRFAIDWNRQMLFGHSFGGLFVLHTLFHRPEAFQMYHAASPSLWMNDRSMLRDVPALMEQLKEAGHPIRLQITVGEEERPGYGAPPAREEILRVRRQVDNAQELSDLLMAGAKKEQLEVTFEVLLHEDHGTMLLPSANRALQMLLPPRR